MSPPRTPHACVYSPTPTLSRFLLKAWSSWSLWLFYYSSLINVPCPLISSLEELIPPELSCREVFLPVHCRNLVSQLATLLLRGQCSVMVAKARRGWDQVKKTYAVGSIGPQGSSEPSPSTPALGKAPRPAGLPLKLMILGTMVKSSEHSISWLGLSFLCFPVSGLWVPPVRISVVFLNDIPRPLFSFRF